MVTNQGFAIIGRMWCYSKIQSKLKQCYRGSVNSLKQLIGGLFISALIIVHLCKVIVGFSLQ